ncbi:MAG: YgjV family protein [Clostridia bacterium]|nr:YgjV family protein [Clostridia bacterium]
MEILGQIIGIIATGITALSYQTNTKKSLLIVQTSATVCTCLSYLFLEASSGFALNIVCILRNLCFYFQKEGKKPIYISTAVISMIMAYLGMISWQGLISLFIILALILNTFFLSLGKPQILRYSILMTSTMVMVYNIYIFSIGGIVNESIAIVSSVIGILRFRKARRF